MNTINTSYRVSGPQMTAEQVSDNADMKQEEKVHRLSQQFEAILLRQILSESQKSVIKSKYNPESNSGSIYHDMINFQMADGISQGSGVGFGKKLEQQLTRQLRAQNTESTTATDLAPTAEAGQIGKAAHDSNH